MTATSNQRPEALARFAETSRNSKRTDRPGLVADAATAPLPTDPSAKDEAVAKVLQEGVSGLDHGAEQAIDRLPDRILESRSESASNEGQEPDSSPVDRAPYDATMDPRTGRPPLPIEADEMNRERELRQLRNAQLSEGEDEAEMDDMAAIDEEAEIDVTLEEDESPSGPDVNGGTPARMVSPKDDGDEDDYGRG